MGEIFVVRGLYTSALGMITQMQKMDVVSNNIANVDTTGFKTDVAVTHSFSEEMFRKLDDPLYDKVWHSQRIGGGSLGVFVSSVHTFFDQGAFTHTEGTLDFALDTDGFFAVNVLNDDGDPTMRLTRDGSFVRRQDGILVTSEGNIVLGEGGQIEIPEGEIIVSPDGSIYVGGEFIDRLQTYNVTNPETLRKAGDNLYDTIDETELVPYAGRIVQGYLEKSNVNAVNEMVKMINLSKVYNANAKMIEVHDATLTRAATDIAKYPT